MHAYERMNHRRQRGALGVGVIGMAELAARMEDRVLDGQASIRACIGASSAS
jgi:hypothetical protein